MTTMKAVRLLAPESLRFTEEPIPVMGPEDVLLAIRSVGVCASDVHFWVEGAIGDAVIKAPLVLGHEVGAEVAAVGEAVSGLAPGDRVAVEPGNNCGECPVCKRGLVNLCPNVQFFGTPPVDGALRQFVAWPARLCIKIPDSMTFEEAAMTEPMAVGIYALDLAALKGGESVVVLGAGAIGLSVVQAARVAGAGSITVVEPIRGRAELAHKLGATAVVSGDPEAAVERLWEESGGQGVDVVFECAGTNEAVQEAVRLASYDGLVVVAGIPFPDEVRFPASTARRKNLTFKFVRRSRNAVERAVEWTEEQKIDLQSYVTHRFALENSADALELARQKRDGVLRAVIELT